MQDALRRSIEITVGHCIGVAGDLEEGKILVVGVDLSLAQAERKVARGLAAWVAHADPVGPAEEDAPASEADVGADSATPDEAADEDSSLAEEDDAPASEAGAGADSATPGEVEHGDPDIEDRDPPTSPSGKKAAPKKRGGGAKSRKR